MSDDFDAWMAAGAPGTLRQWQAMKRMAAATHDAQVALDDLSGVLLEAEEPMRRFSAGIDRAAQCLERERIETVRRVRAALPPEESE